MALVLTSALLRILLVSTLVAGAITGIAGFGFAIVGTMALATVIDPPLAVVFMIIPILSVNLSLASELSTEELRDCGRRFGPLIAAALLGTVVGLAALQRVPEAPLRVGLGLLTIGFVVSVHDEVTVPGLDRVRAWCFVESPLAMVGVGVTSGLVFGATNVGVQLIAYLRSFELSHGLFVAVVAVVFLGLNVVRIGVAGLLGMYPDLTTVGVSVVAAVPAVVGVAIGTRIRTRLGNRSRRSIVLGLLTVVGIRLLLGGAGLV